MQAERLENPSAEENETAESLGAKREVSTIAFPYSDLDDAVLLVKSVNGIGGQSCEWEQLAAVLKVVPSGGGYRARLSQARIFGVLNYGQGKITLTPLGLRIADPTQEEAARVDAFVTVPLYRALYDKYKGYALPKPDALEREMASLGVSSKQTDKARQAFERSAKQAGFHWAGADRLTLPAIKGKPETPPLDTSADRRKGGGGGGDDSDLDLDPLLVALLRKIPPTADGWPRDQRLRWFRTFAMNVSQVYDDTDTVDLKITLQKPEEAEA